MIKYRKAEKDDIDALTKIRMTFIHEVSKIEPEEEKMLFQANMQYFQTALLDNSFVVWLALNGDEIVGMCGITFYNLPPNKKCPNNKVAYITNTYTLSNYRNQGIASKLFAYIIEESKNREHYKIMLNATDMGRPIYEKHGFQDIANEMIYYIK